MGLAGIEQRTIRAGEIDFGVLCSGPDDGEPVLLLHGFAELAHSWRHQLRALGDAGIRCVAPDMRGVSATAGPPEVEAYDMPSYAGDVVALLDALGAERGIVVGHDTGADIAWRTTLLHPGRVRAVAGLSAPYVPRAPQPPLELMREHLGEDFYFVWFQEPGVADAALAKDVRRTITTREVWDAEWATRHDEPPRPRFMTEDDLAVYVESYGRTGFTGGLNWYRNIDRNWELLAPLEGRRIEQPALFVTGSRDPVMRFAPPSVMDGQVTDLEVVIVEGAGHWVQQQRPEEVNDALLGFVARVRDGDASAHA
jgi:pimeloyl-ACP methyl ester carboxylesterase